MSKDEFMVKFRGVRGGYPMPGPTTVKYGGNTTSLENSLSVRQVANLSYIFILGGVPKEHEDSFENL